MQEEGVRLQGPPCRSIAMLDTLIATSASRNTGPLASVPGAVHMEERAVPRPCQPRPQYHCWTVLLASAIGRQAGAQRSRHTAANMRVRLAIQPQKQPQDALHWTATLASVTLRQVGAKKKQEYCCKHEGKACPTTTPDCWYQLAMWDTAWTQQKKNWCCQNQNKGCMFISEAEPGNSLSPTQSGKATKNAEGSGKTVAIIAMMLTCAVLLVSLVGIARSRWIVAGSGLELSSLIPKHQKEEASGIREFHTCPQESDGEEEE
mmetsp:Transcript_101185/g.201001  ORF Transcript_101185/g.201001 Transcript_101185/m.201001 type:complete len:262 (-) Transcript_101185:187-972(-)